MDDLQNLQQQQQLDLQANHAKSQKEQSDISYKRQCKVITFTNCKDLINSQDEAKKVTKEMEAYYQWLLKDVI